MDARSPLSIEAGNHPGFGNHAYGSISLHHMIADRMWGGFPKAPLP